MMADHLKKSCEKRPLSCAYCKTMIRRDELTAHVRKHHADEFQKSADELVKQYTKLREQTNETNRVSNK